MPEICGIPISYASVDEYSWAYKTKAMVLFLQNHIQLMKEKPEIISSNMFDYYNKSRGDIHTKELWVVEKDLAKEARSLATLRKYYTYPIKVVKPEDIQEAIEKNDTNVVFLHKVGPEGTRLQARCYVMIIGIGENKLYYWNYHMGNSGVQVITVQRILDMLNHNILPIVYDRGSLGASGDLAPLSNLFLPLLGLGEVKYQGVKRNAEDVLKELGWQPIELQSKEGLALLNGTQFMPLMRSHHKVNPVPHFCLHKDNYGFTFPGMAFSLS